jgi:DNA-binding MarR family transcriptional regulator
MSAGCELHTPSAAVVTSGDDVAAIVPSWDELVFFRDDPARIVARVDDRCRGSVTHMDPPPDDAREGETARREALRKAVKSALQHRGTRADGPENGRRRCAPLEQRRLAEHDLVDEITSAAQRIADARDWNADPVYRTDGIWRVLATVARSSHCLAIADLARALRLRRQAAHRLAHQAVRAGVIELVPNPQDKRLLQAFVTPQGRAKLAASRIAEEVWLATLLNGLDDHELKATLRVVRFIRRRLERGCFGLPASRPQ